MHVLTCWLPERYHLHVLESRVAFLLMLHLVLASPALISTKGICRSFQLGCATCSDASKCPSDVFSHWIKV